MQFVIIAKDGSDADALQRRLAAREAHIANTECNKPHMLMGAATLNENGAMSGSIMIVEFSDRTLLDRWLESEPYVTENVWQDITILPCQVGASFESSVSEGCVYRQTS